MWFTHTMSYFHTMWENSSHNNIYFKFEIPSQRFCCFLLKRHLMERRCFQSCHCKMTNISKNILINVTSINQNACCIFKLSSVVLWLYISYINAKYFELIVHFQGNTQAISLVKFSPMSYLCFTNLYCNQCSNLETFILKKVIQLLI